MKILKIGLLVAMVLMIVFVGILTCHAEANVVASWYGGGEDLNECTANGEIFDDAELTCASWYYPFGTVLKVTNLENGKWVIVRVNDRGPNKRLGRAIDLTRYAFSRISDLRQGLIKVNIERVA